MNLTSFFLIDTLAITISALVAIVAMIVIQYAKNYLHGDQKQGLFYFNLSALLISTWLMLFSNNILVFIAFFFLEQLFIISANDSQKSLGCS